MDVLQALEVLELATLGMLKLGSNNADVHTIKVEARAKIGEPINLRGIFRYISAIPKSEKERVIIERNEAWEEWDKT